MAFGKIKVDQIESNTKVIDVDDLVDGASLTSEIGVTIQPFDANTLTSTDIGVTVQGFDATTLTADDIGVTVQGFDATTLTADDIATNEEAEAGAVNDKLMTPLRTAEAIAALATGGAVLYNRRPALHRGPLFFKTADTTISIVSGSVLNGYLYESATAVTMPGSFTNNTDYAIWQHPTNGDLVADDSFTTAPAGATGGSIVGGFHYIPSGRPTAVNNGSPTTTAEILEYSIWDLTWRPDCPDPRGMANIDGRFWCDLYLCGKTSYAGTDFSAVPSSRIGLTIADNNDPPLIPAFYGGNGTTAYSTTGSLNAGSWINFGEVAQSFGKRLMSYHEFAAAAFGAPEAGSRGSDPGTVIWERQSKWGLAQATGTMRQWGSDFAGTGSTSNANHTGGRGTIFASDTKAVILGGRWSDGANSGSRAARWGSIPWSGNNTISARFAAGHLVLG